ncbi:MAG: hypothetical protein V2A72_04995 [Candidatus Omnitrophota bacterium]
MRTKKASEGFLLLEVLISIVIVASTLIVINRAFSTSLRAVRLAGNYLSANYILEDKMFDVLIKDAFADTMLSDTLEIDQKKFFYETEVTQVSLDKADDDQLPIKQANLSVNWDDASTQSRASVSTYVWQEEE